MDKGPVIPSPAGMDALRIAEDKIAEAKIRAVRRMLARRRLARIDPVDRIRPDGLEMRKLAAFSEEYKRGIEKYAEALKQSQIKWQKEAGTVIQDILKIGDNAAELYEAFQEYPFSDNFKDYSKDKETAANKRDFRMSLINQAIALYYWNNLKDLDKLKITDKPEFKEVQHFINTLKAKTNERANLYKAAKEGERQAGLAEFQIAHSQKRERESAAHSTFIQRLPDEIGRATYARRLLKAGYVKDYSEQAQQRATELENVLAYVERHRQDTEAKIDAYISQAQKRANAVGDALTRQTTSNQICQASARRATEAIIRTTNATNRSLANPHYYKDLAYNIVIGTVTPANITRCIKYATREARNAERRARNAERRARDAETRARNAERRARDAETRAIIAKSYNNPQISDELAKNVVKYARMNEKLEKEVVSNAYLIQANAIQIQNELRSIVHSLRSMQGTTLKPRLAPQNRRNMLVELANKIEKAEICKNSVIDFEEQATIAEQTSLNNIRNESHNELAALASENVTETAITNLANQDLPHLQNLVAQQRALEETLKGTPALGARRARSGLIERERAESQLMRRIEEAIRGRAASIAANKGAELTQSNAVRRRRTEFERALTNLMNAERAAAEALKRNAIHMERDVTGDADQAIEHLQKIKNNFANHDDEALKNLSKGHLFIDPKVGKFTIGKPAIWESVRKINSWGPTDYTTVSTGQTPVEFRPDIVTIELETITREGGKMSIEPIYTKRLAKRVFQSADYRYVLEIPGDGFANHGRRIGTLTYIDLRRVGKAKDGGNSIWTEAECTRVETFNMEATGVIRIKENHNNQSNPVEPSFSVHTETMPSNPIIDHALHQQRREGPGWSYEQKRRMCKIDLDRRILILPNGLEFPIDEFDWSETKWDEENGLTLQFKGPRELSQVNLLAAGSSDIFAQKLSDTTTALKKKKRDHLENGIEWLKQSIRSYDEYKIDNALESIQSFEGIASYQSSITKNELERPPKNRLDLEQLRKKKKAQKDARTPKWVAASLEGTADMLLARQSYESQVKERIQTIHNKNPLSAEYVWKSRARPDIYSIQKHTSSKKKQELLDEIRAANHLDKTVPFQLLEDPKQGPASATSPVKNATPNGLELLQEYNRYKNQQDFANQTERQNVEQYVASIATEFRMNPNIHLYYANQWNLERAMEAVTRGDILSKVVDGRTIIGASDYIRNLKQVDCPPDSDDSIAGLRQADEYRCVLSLRRGLAEASAEHLAEVLQKSLSVALWMQRSRYSNLKLAAKALDLETTSDEAKWFIEDIDLAETPLPWSETETDQKAKADTTKDKNKFDPKTQTDKSQAELAQEASASAEQIYKHATDAIDRLIESTDDPVLQKKYREEAVKMAMDMAKQAFEINKQDKAIQDNWQKLEVYIKEVNAQRWKDLIKDIALLWLKTSVEIGSKGAQNFMNELEKIVMKMVS